MGLGAGDDPGDYAWADGWVGPAFGGLGWGGLQLGLFGLGGWIFWVHFLIVLFFSCGRWGLMAFE